MLPIGLQVYSLREALAQDFYGTLKQVAHMGYQGVELFGSLPAARELKAQLDGMGLEVAGRHATLDQLNADFEALADHTLELGAKYLVCAWSKANPTWATNAQQLAQLAQRAEHKGLKLLYHNHAHEIEEQYSDQPALDYLLSQSSSLGAEPDIAWLYAGGADPVAFLERYAGRTPLLHVKDVHKNGSEWETVELGSGEVPLGATLAKAPAAGVEWLLIEQDHSPNPIASAKQNIAWLKSMA